MEIWLWVGFIALVLVFLALDLGVFHKGHQEISTKEALKWTGIWIMVSLLFNVFIYYAYEHHLLGIGHHIGVTGGDMNGKEAATAFLTGYLIEKSLSVDNIFVIALIFSYFQVPLKYQHEVLFWGILGALVFRAIMIYLGSTLMTTFWWTNYLFGAILLYSAIKLWFSGDDEVEPEKNPVIILARKVLPVTDSLGDGKFRMIENGKKVFTRLFIVLLVVETTDVMFAVDSIPAIFAVTTDPFLVFTSNVFAILGLRSLYFALASIMDKFRFLKEALVLVLGFVGVKMMLVRHFHIDSLISLGVIVLCLAGGVLASMYIPKSEEELAEEAAAGALPGTNGHSENPMEDTHVNTPDETATAAKNILD